MLVLRPLGGTRITHAAALAASGVLLLITAGTASATEPTGDFTISPAVGVIGQPVTFTPSGLGDPDVVGVLGLASVTWEFENGGSPVVDNTEPYEAQQHTYLTPGTKNVTMTVTDLTSETHVATHAFRVNRSPTAAFSYSPTIPNVGARVNLSAATSTDDVAIPNAGFSWDLDNDGQYDDATGQAVGATFASGGDKTVRLRVTDADSAVATTTRTVHVNLAPKATFVFSPRAPIAGDAVDFTSISADPDGPVTSEAWDLDGDGQYDDATGRTARHAYSLAGTYRVRLRVTDSHGRTDAIGVDLLVAPKPNAPKPVKINPWPVIRIVGFASVRRTRIDLLSVRTVTGALVKVRCKGKGCPKRDVTSTTSKGKVVRLRWLERRLRRGTRIYIAVTVPGRIGRYETFLVRKGKQPRRHTLCLYPGVAKPRKCS